MINDSFNVGLIVYSFYSGLSTILAPCIYPLIPLLASAISVIAAQCTTRSKTVYIFTIFTLGICLVNFFVAAIFAFAGITSRNLFQGPFMPCLLIAINGYLAFFSEEAAVRIPSTLLNMSTKKTNGAWTIFLSGIVTCTSSLPCTGPALANILSLIALNNEFVKGSILLFFYCLGIAIPYMLLGFFQSSFKKMPRTGVWLDYIKLFMSLTMLWSVTIYSLDAFHAFESYQSSAKDDTYREVISKIKDAKKSNKKILLSFGASWCESCMQLHEEILHNMEFLSILKKYNYELIQVDLSFASLNEEIAKTFKVIGLPELIILNQNTPSKIGKRINLIPKKWNGKIDLHKFVQIIISEN
ncbi:MAG: thioredoxin family protein [Deltaproteobacteria bacterium]|nr:MAG: thioredoxin family protein [Deltaproteobacteria bacterium]